MAHVVSETSSSERPCWHLVKYEHGKRADAVSDQDPTIAGLGEQILRVLLHDEVVRGSLRTANRERKGSEWSVNHERKQA